MARESLPLRRMKTNNGIVRDSRIRPRLPRNYPPAHPRGPTWAQRVPAAGISATLLASGINKKKKKIREPGRVSGYRVDRSDVGRAAYIDDSTRSRSLATERLGSPVETRNEKPRLRHHRSVDLSRARARARARALVTTCVNGETRKKNG